ncbi:MAG TPA: cytochrome c [Thioalkalivibrio sp.]|nr:cytochrome c [Thioalkalivibrio sp.]
MKRIMTLTTLLAALASTPTLAADLERGKQLHRDNCMACHARMTGGEGETLYTRNGRRVTSLPGLEAQVRRCEANLELKWFDEDIADVVHFLNQTYYHF